MSDTHLDAKFDGEIFRKDHPIILAANRHLASLRPVRLAYVDANGYDAGTVLARNTVNGYYYAYDDNGSSGLDTAACVLFEDATPASGSTMLARAVFGGEVFYTKLTGIDTNGITDLGGRLITDAFENQILKF